MCVNEYLCITNTLAQVQRPQSLIFSKFLEEKLSLSIVGHAVYSVYKTSSINYLHKPFYKAKLNDQSRYK